MLLSCITHGASFLSSFAASQMLQCTLVNSVLECKHGWACLQMCILDGNAYDAKCLEAGQEREEDLDGCSLLLNNKVQLRLHFVPSCHGHTHAAIPVNYTGLNQNYLLVHAARACRLLLLL